MPPPPIGDTGLVSHILYGVRGKGGVNRQNNDRDGVTVLDGAEAKAAIAALRHYPVDRQKAGLHGLREMMKRGSVALENDAPYLLNRFAFFGPGLAVNFAQHPAVQGASVGRVQR